MAICLKPFIYRQFQALFQHPLNECGRGSFPVPVQRCMPEFAWYTANFRNSQHPSSLKRDRRMAAKSCANAVSGRNMANILTPHHIVASCVHISHDDMGMLYVRKCLKLVAYQGKTVTNMFTDTIKALQQRCSARRYFRVILLSSKDEREP